MALAAMPAQAQIGSADFGSAILQTKRNCPTDASIVCNGTLPGQQIVERQSSGGAGQVATNTFNATGTGIGSSAFGTVNFGGFGLPEIKASVTSVGNVRLSGFIATYQSYTYTGEDDFDLLLSATLHVDNASSDGRSGAYPGGATASAGFAIWDAEDFFRYSDAYFTGDGTFNSPASLYNQNYLFGGFQCEDFDALADPDDLPVGPRATNWAGGSMRGGETSVSVGQQNCHEQTLTISKGDQFVIATFEQLTANRGGFIDATGTFNIGLDPNMGATNIAAFQSGAKLGLAPVPEPTVWGMMIAGFGFAGGTLRLRSRKAPPALA